MYTLFKYVVKFHVGYVSNLIITIPRMIIIVICIISLQTFSRIQAAEVRFLRHVAGYTLHDHRGNTDIPVSYTHLFCYIYRAATSTSNFPVSPVSYTHLDVYKRQIHVCVCLCISTSQNVVMDCRRG